MLKEPFRQTEASLLNDPTVAQTVLFPDLVDRLLAVTFDQAHARSDGGAIPLKGADRALCSTTRLARVLPDPRPAARLTHAWSAVLAQQIFGIACGYPDANDADGLADSPIQKLLLDRDPITGGRLAGLGAAVGEPCDAFADEIHVEPVQSWLGGRSHVQAHVRVGPGIQRAASIRLD